MKKFKAKLMALLVAVGCCSVCLGAGVALAQQEPVNITASAEVTTHNIGALTLHVNSQPWGGAGGASNQLYLQRADGGALPVLTWEHLFTYESGDGFKVNGVKKTPNEIKSTGEGFFWLFNGLNAGDEITISGTFYCESMQTRYVIEKSTFVWNGTNWEVGVDVSSYTAFMVDELYGANGSSATALYAYDENHISPLGGNDNWADKLTFLEGSGKGVCLNGTPLTGWDIKQPGDFYIGLGGATAQNGDVVMIDGIFYNAEKEVKVIFNNSCLQYDGTTWVSYGTSDSYNVTQIGQANGSSKTVIYAYPLDENEKTGISSWDHAFSFRKGSGDGITLNGDRLANWGLKQPGDFYIVLGKEAVEGDVLKLDGIFYNTDPEISAQIEFHDSTLQYDGANWVAYKEVTIAPTNIGKVQIGGGSSESAVYFAPINIKNFPVVDGSWAEKLTFKIASGAGVTINGERIVMNDIKIPGDIYVGLGKTAAVGDILAIEGEFYNETLGVNYKIAASKFIWTGTAWEVAYTTYNVGAVKSVEANDVVGGYFAFNETLPVNSWDYAYALESGKGITINGVSIDMNNNVKSVERLYAGFGEVKAGDVLNIEGTFYNLDTETKYVVSDSTFVFDGIAWVDYIVCNLGEVAGISGDNSGVYMGFASGVTLPVDSWDHAFTLESGDGIKVDDVAVDLSNNNKSVGNKLYVALTNVEEGSVLSVSGTFCNEAKRVKYIISDSQFVWNGSAWETYVNYTTYEIGTVVIGANSVAEKVYFDPASGGKFAVTDGTWTEKLTFETGSGIGVTLNGTQIDMGDIKIPNNMFVGLGKTAVTDDVLAIGGTFYNANLAVKYVIEESKFTWNGSAWEEYVDYTTYDVGKVTIINKDSSATALNIDPVGGKWAVTDPTWAEKLTFLTGSGVGITLNGNQINMNDIKIPNNLYVALGTTAVAGDILVIGGTFYNKNLAVKYIVEESKFIFNGADWNELVSNYTISNLKPTASSTSKTPVYLKINGNTDLPIVNSSYSFTKGTITFVKQDGTDVSITAIKSTADGFTFRFTGSKVADGDVLTLSGTVYCAALDVTYDIQACRIRWTGSAWELYVPTYEIGTVTIGANSSATAVYFDKASGDAFEVTDGTWAEKLTYESGTGVTLNGTKINMNDIKIPNNLYVGLGTTAKKGDMLVIGGTFYNTNLDVKYVIEDSTFTFNGTNWVPYVAVTTYNIGALALHVNSTVGGAKGDNSLVYLTRADGEALPVLDWGHAFVYESGTGFMVNGVQKTPTEIKSTRDGFYWKFNAAVPAGATITIGGTFLCETLAVKYVIEDSEFTWTGSAWVTPKPNYSNLVEGVAYDKVTILDLGLGLETTANGTFDGAGLSYVASSANTTGSVVFRFGFTASDVETNATDIRMRGTAWNGIRFILGGGALQSWYLEQSEGVALVNNQYYVIELGAIDTADGNSIWIYAKVDGLLVISNVVAKTDVVVPLVGSEFDGTTFGDYTSNHISIYSGNSHATWSDPDHVAVTYKTNLGMFVDYAERNSAYSLLGGKTYEMFIGWMADGNLYEAGATISVGDDNLVFEALSIEFFLEDGAAIRLSDSTNESGIRFTTRISEAGLTKLQNNGVTVVSYGTLIIPLDYLGAGQAPNLEQFNAGENIVKIPSTYQETEDGYVVYRGAMKKLNEGNYERLFAGRSYMEISVNGVNKIIYTNFDLDDNVRSIRYVAQEFKADTAEYNAISDTKKAVVDVYAAEGIIDLMNYKSYQDNNFLNLIAWYYPELDPSNQYDNQYNRDIAKDLTDAGMKAIYLDGAHHLDLNTDENIEKTRQIIHFFWSRGLYTIAFGSNASANCYIDYSSRTFPDFSDCQGFLGFLVWDEPGSGSMSTLASFANNFETIYAGSGVTFMVNLLPSYATDFNAGSSYWWESSLDTLNKDAYKAYMQAYCETVLSQLDGGKKWLSLDSYPINADYSLTPNFLFDLAMLKYYAEQYDAHAHSVLQSSGWIEGGNDSKNRMPEEAELRMQAYTAMAFGMDSISWWSYGNMRGDNQQNPADNDTYYEPFKNVNVELQKISHIYSAFNRWQGVILGTGKDNGVVDEDYEAYAAVKGQIGDYELSATDTKHLASISTNKTDLNYLMGVSQDMNGNECYVISNYNSHEENRAQTLTLNFATNVTQVIIYRGGEATPQAVNSKTLTISLATGEGVIVIPSALA